MNRVVDYTAMGGKEEIDTNTQYTLNSPKGVLEFFGDKEELVNPINKGIRNRIPQIEFFEENLIQLKHVRNNIDSMKTVSDIFWLKVQCNSLKDSLLGLVDVWIEK